MNSIKTALIFFAIFLLVLVGAAVFLSNPEGTADAVFTGLEEVLVELELNKEDLLSCVNDGTYNDRINKDIDAARAFGFSGTPVSILLDMQTGNTVVLEGAFPFEILGEVVNKLMNDNPSEGDVLFDDADLGVNLVVSRLEVSLNEEDHLRGSSQARMALIEYSDLDCQYCASFHGTALRFLVEYEDQAVWAYRHFPLLQIHPAAMKKAAVGECAASFKGEEAFWAIIDSYYLNSQK